MFYRILLGNFSERLFINAMKKRTTALTTVILIIISNTGILFANNHSDCKMIEQQTENHCEMMEMKMDCCPMEVPADQGCDCPEMNSENQTETRAPQYILVKSLENPGKIVLKISTLSYLKEALNRSYVNSFNPLIPNTKIYKTIQSFLI